MAEKTDLPNDAHPSRRNGAKRILIFSLAYYPRFVGGAEVAIKEITDRIGGFEFDMITLRLDKNLPAFERIGNVNIHRIGWAKADPTDRELLAFPLYLAKVFYAPLAFWKAKRLDRALRSNGDPGYDALWSVMSYMGFPALFFKWFYRDVPFVLTLQEGDSLEHVADRWRIRLIMPLYRAVFHRAAIVQAISHYLADFARRMEAGKKEDNGKYGKESQQGDKKESKNNRQNDRQKSAAGNDNFIQRIEVVPNGVDPELFSSRPSDTELFELKTRLGKKYTDTFLITASRLVEKNGVADCIRALKFLPAETKLIIAGTGPLEHALKELVLREGLMSRVLFLGFIPHEELPNYLRVSDIFVRPSLSEGFGNSFIEAMAAEIPVIGTPVGGIVDFLENGRTGVFCEPNDPQSIARAVEKILSNHTFRASLVANAKELVAERYGWDLIAGEMRDRVFAKVF